MTGVRDYRVFYIVPGSAGCFRVSCSQFGRNDPVVFRADHDLSYAEGQQCYGRPATVPFIHLAGRTTRYSKQLLDDPLSALGVRVGREPLQISRTAQDHRSLQGQRVCNP